MLSLNFGKVKDYVMDLDFLDNPYIAIPIAVVIAIIFVFVIVSIKAFILIKGLSWLFDFDIPFWKSFFAVILLSIVTSSFSVNTNK